MDWRAVRFDWNHARAFLVTAEEGSFSAAARALGLAQPTVGRQVAALEQELGVALFERVGNGLALTEAGIGLLEHVRGMGAAATKVSLSAAGTAEAVEGVVRITASQLISAFLLPPVVERLRREHPGIRLEIAASNEVRDLLRREADIAIRNVAPAHADLVGKRLRDATAGGYATAAYLASIGDPATPADLGRAAFFGFENVSLMLEYFRAFGIPATERNFPVVTDDHLVQWELARRGLGICLVMEEVGDADPAMRRVVPDVLKVPVPMWLVTHREVRTSRRIRLVFDALAEGLGQSRQNVSGV